MRRFTSRSEAETERVGAQLARALAPSGIALLEGDLGSGKTVLVRGLARALGIERSVVQSPTYALIHEYEGSGGRLVHVDLYRLEGEELLTLGLDELLAGDGVVAIEWAERLVDFGEIPGALRVRLRRLGTEAREISFDGDGLDGEA